MSVLGQIAVAALFVALGVMILVAPIWRIRCTKRAMEQKLSAINRCRSSRHMEMMMTVDVTEHADAIMQMTDPLELYDPEVRKYFA